jgi:general secretion pathway protein D
MNTTKRARQLVLLALVTNLLGLLGGCATVGPGANAYRQGGESLQRGDWTRAVGKLEEAVRLEPSNRHYSTQLAQAKYIAGNGYVTEARRALDAGRLDEAEAILKRMRDALGPDDRAAALQREIEARREYAQRMAQIEALLGAQKKAEALPLIREALRAWPRDERVLAVARQVEDKPAAPNAWRQLKTNFIKPVSLQFRDANLKQVFEFLSRSTGVNFILDKDLRDDKVSVYVKEVTLEEALDLLLTTNQLDKKVLNANSVLIYPNTQPKQREYQELVTKAFYLANADAKQTVSMIKTLVKTKDVYVDDKLNLLIMRDTPEAIRAAERLIDLQDRAEPEVMLEVEVMEIERDQLRSLGLKLPEAVSISTIPKLTLGNIADLTRNDYGVSSLAATLNLSQKEQDVNLLANPKIRVKNREKAKIHIGDKLPVITTTAATAGEFFTESVQYLEVGIRLEVETDISRDQMVGIKLNLEVSSAGAPTQTKNGSTVFPIGSRSATTVLRLKDGETQVLAGLISDQERNSTQKLPLVGEIPVLGRLFSNKDKDRRKTEIVLAITPRLVRSLEMPAQDGLEFWSGTESKIGGLPLTLKTPTTSAFLTSGSSSLRTQATPYREVDIPVAPPNQSGAAQPATLQMSKAEGPVRLTWIGPTGARAGDTVAITLRGEGGEDLYKLPYQVIFDPTVLKFEAAEEGDLLKTGGVPTSFQYSTDPGGRINISYGRTQPSTAETGGSGSVATFRFRVASAKDSAVLKVNSAGGTDTAGQTVRVALPPPFSLKLDK